MPKLKEIEVAFKALLKDMLVKSVGILNKDDKQLVNEYATLMTKEVSIRTELK